MVAHVVLFTPKTTLSPAARSAFVRALEAAITGIPDIARARVGRRVRSNRPYEGLAPSHEYVAILEFASVVALQRYLAHPAHQALGAAFYTALERADVTDFEVVDDVATLLG